ncbi:MAG TPA: arginine--tRNA ligase, partial [Phycisphaerae bacterium]|nr:arginine--tRNA ligase [Phycisphaerae bacterium]
DLAEKVVAAAELSDLTEKVEIAGPGFINIHLKADWLAERLNSRLGDERLGVEPARPSQTVVVDYSGPNLAKEMHVGHLRSTIIGDAIVRTLEFLGHPVVRHNHVGDWGTQFGMLTAYVEERGVLFKQVSLGKGAVVTLGGGPGIEDMEELYRLAKERYETDAGFAEKARQYVVELQRGDWRVQALWEFVVAQSLEHAERVYTALGVTLHREHVRGESAYNDDLPRVIEALRAAGLLTESDGAQCVFLEEFRNRDGEIIPCIVRKSDGGYLYATTDLAAIRYRTGTLPEGQEQLHADRILYVVDARQKLHLRQVFAVARAAGFAPPSVSLEHVAFGTMMGADGKPFKTREGGTVKLMALLDEAEQRAFDLVGERSPDLPEGARREIARVVGIGAVKYADLCQNRESDYVFSWDKMLSLEGNTAPYMQYAYARVQSIFRKGGQEIADLPAGRHGCGLRIADLGQAGDGSSEPAGSPRAGITLAEPPERLLGLKLARFGETVDAVARECLPNRLCEYLYDLAGAFMGFYESCPVLKADGPLRASRLALCRLTADTIRTGLGLLGIETPDQM